MIERRDVVVVGAGPAGSAAAIVCARAGLDVLVVERQRFPRPKVCGCCLDPSALEALGRLGIGDRIVRYGLRLERAEVHAWGRRAELPVGGVVISRERLDADLAEQARFSGAELLWSFRAGVGALREGLREVELHPSGSAGHGPRRVRARLVVVACGLGGRAGLEDTERGATRRVQRVGLGATLAAGAPALPPGTVRMAAADDGYVGLVGLEDGRLDVAASVRRAALEREGPDRVVERILAAAGAPPLAADLDWRGTPTLRSTPAPDSERVVTVGDAAGFWEPFTGEGIGWALEAGERLAPLARRLARGGHPSGSLAAQIVSRAWLLRRQVRSRAVAWLAAGRRRSHVALALAERWPRVGRLGSRRIDVEREKAA